VAETGRVREVLRNPLHPYTRDLLKAIPPLEHKQQRLYVIPGAPPKPSETATGCAFYPRCVYKQDICAVQELVLASGITLSVIMHKLPQPSRFSSNLRLLYSVKHELFSYDQPFDFFRARIAL